MRVVGLVGEILINRLTDFLDLSTILQLSPRILRHSSQSSTMGLTNLASNGLTSGSLFSYTCSKKGKGSVYSLVHVTRLKRLYNLPVYLPDILNKPTVMTRCYQQDGTRRCMSGSKLCWQSAYLCYHHDATTNLTGIKPSDRLCESPNANDYTTAIFFIFSH